MASRIKVRFNNRVARTKEAPARRASIPRELHPYLVTYISARHGISIEDAKLLVERVGQDLTTLNIEAAKLDPRLLAR